MTTKRFVATTSASGRVNGAARALAVLPGRVQERLVSAANELLVPEPSAFAEGPLRESFEEIRALLTADGPAHRSCAALSDDQAMEIAQEILSLSDRLDAAFEDTEP